MVKIEKILLRFLLKLWIGIWISAFFCHFSLSASLAYPWLSQISTNAIFVAPHLKAFFLFKETSNKPKNSIFWYLNTNFHAQATHIDEMTFGKFNFYRSNAFLGFDLPRDPVKKLPVERSLQVFLIYEPTSDSYRLLCRYSSVPYNTTWESVWAKKNSRSPKIASLVAFFANPETYEKKGSKWYLRQQATAVISDNFCSKTLKVPICTSFRYENCPDFLKTDLSSSSFLQI